MSKSNACPNKDSLTHFVDDGGSDGTIALHVRNCQNCQSKLDEICQDEELETWGKSNDSATPFADGPERERVVQRLSSIAVSQNVDNESTHRLQEIDVANLARMDHYQILRNIGSGGMSIVYEAIDLRLKRSVAIKLLRNRDSMEPSIARFLREASAIANIHHPNVVTIFQIETESTTGVPYLVMELIDGPTLQAWLNEQKTIEPEQAAIWISEIADGLAAAHASGIIHRDIKPSNILLCTVSPSQTAKAFTAKLADFGLAQTDNIDSQLTQTGVLTGTPAYVSPEQLIDNATSNQSDIYSLGITLFQILTGELPFRGSPHAVLKQIAEEEIPGLRKLNPTIPADLETICLKATSHSPSQRYETAKDFGDDLRRWLRGESIRARPTSVFERASRWIRRNRRVATLLFAIGFLLLMIASGSIWSNFVLTKAGNALAEQVKTAQAATRTAEAASAQAETHRQVAEEQKRRAIEQRTIAVDSINTLLEEVQQKLDFNAGALRLREQLIKTAINGLAKIANSGDSDSLQRPTMSAYYQLANVQRFLGKVEDAKKTTDVANAFAEAAFKRDSNDPDIIYGMGLAKSMRADAIVLSVGAEAKAIYIEAAELLKRAIESKPNETAYLRYWIAFRGKIGEIDLNAGRFTEARRWIEPALADIADLSKHEPSMTTLLRDHGIMLRRQAQTLSGLREPGARALLGQAVEIAETGRAREPDNPIYRADLAFMLGTLSRMDCNESQFQDGIAHATKSVAEFEAIVATDPSNTQYLTNVCATYDFLCQAYLAAEELDNAHISAQKGYDMCQKLIQRYPQAMRFRLMQAETAMRMCDLRARQMRYQEGVLAGELAESVLEVASHLSDSNADILDPAKALFKLQVDAMRIIALGENVADTHLHPMLNLASKAYFHAQHEQWDIAMELSKKVVDELNSSDKATAEGLDQTQRIFCLLNAARSAAITFKKRDAASYSETDTEDSSKSRSPDSSQSKALALQLLRMAIVLSPTIRQNLHMEPDLSYLRDDL